MPKSAGEIAHDQDVKNIPFTTITGKDLYPRKGWDELGQGDRDAWERLPVPRKPI